jgi:hypothetical protein
VTRNSGGFCKFGDMAPGSQARMTVVIRTDLFANEFFAFGRQDLEEVRVDFDYENSYEHMFTRVPSPVKVAGLPKGCAKRPFTLEVDVNAATGLKTKLALNNRPLVSSTRPHFHAKIDPDKLGKGTQTLKISIPGKSGPPLYRDTEKFKTC